MSLMISTILFFYLKNKQVSGMVFHGLKVVWLFKSTQFDQCFKSINTG